MIKTTLQLRTGQSFQLTAQLQQSLKFLQLSSLELEQTLHQALSDNPFLTTDNEYSLENISTTNSQSENEKRQLRSEELDEDPALASRVPQTDDSIALYDSFEGPLKEELATDTQWDDYYQGDDSLSEFSPKSHHGADENDYDFFENHYCSVTLYEHLKEQIELSPFSSKEKIIAYHIIDALDEDGYLTCSKEELLLGIEKEDKTYPFIDDFNSVLLRIQRFDPVGLATYCLKDRLLVQLSTLPDSPVKENAQILLCHYHTQLEKRQFIEIVKLSQLEENEIKDALKYLATLDPFPTQKFNSQQQTITVPDIILKKRNNTIDININNQSLPQIRLDTQYVKMLQKSKKSLTDHGSDEKNQFHYLQQAYEEAKNLLVSIENRHKTLLLIATQIVGFQIDFFKCAQGQLKPMTLKNIADLVEMSESTVSRACQNKTLICDKGLFELKHFFQSHVKNEEGENISADNIKMLIKKWIEQENKAKPLSDSKIEGLLATEGLIVARRTVAKYREQLGFSASSLRKKL